mmetsp:Transcript_2053/g.6213  ORF Transcript_2053/g.6213 Transcript_2053/m.6213 type:complete len:251 (-) Transcript_2053:58-810(-)
MAGHGCQGRVGHHRRSNGDPASGEPCCPALTPLLAARRVLLVREVAEGAAGTTLATALWKEVAALASACSVLRRAHGRQRPQLLRKGRALHHRWRRLGARRHGHATLGFGHGVLALGVAVGSGLAVLVGALRAALVAGVLPDLHQRAALRQERHCRARRHLGNCRRHVLRSLVDALGPDALALDLLLFGLAALHSAAARDVGNILQLAQGHPRGRGRGACHGLGRCRLLPHGWHELGRAGRERRRRRGRR